MRYAVTNFERELEKFWQPFWGISATSAQQSWRPHVDIRERDEHWLLSIDVPGVARENLKVDVVEDQLVVSGERHVEKDEKSYSERSYGKFERRFNLPEGTEASKIEASYDHGVLNLVVPKVQPAKPTSIAIDVKEGKGNLFQKLVSFGKKEETAQIN